MGTAARRIGAAIGAGGQQINANRVTAAATSVLAIIAVAAVLAIFRPYVMSAGIKPHILKDHQSHHKMLLIVFKLKNIGDLPARSFRSYSVVTVGKTVLPVVKYYEDGGTDMFPQSGKTFEIKVDIQDQAAALWAGAATLKFEMHGTYRGLFWEPHHFTMVQTFLPATMEFVSSEEH